ncbi:MAG: hypothetical protein NVS3B5_01490 [Sphingomicrobium sp.]
MPADDLRLQPKMTTATEIAVLVKMIPIEQAASLIEQFARTFAAQASLDATIETSDRILNRIGNQK